MEQVAAAAAASMQIGASERTSTGEGAGRPPQDPRRAGPSAGQSQRDAVGTEAGTNRGKRSADELAKQPQGGRWEGEPRGPGRRARQANEETRNGTRGGAARDTGERVLSILRLAGWHLTGEVRVASSRQLAEPDCHAAWGGGESGGRHRTPGATAEPATVAWTPTHPVAGPPAPDGPGRATEGGGGDEGPSVRRPAAGGARPTRSGGRRLLGAAAAALAGLRGDAWGLTTFDEQLGSEAVGALGPARKERDGNR